MGTHEREGRARREDESADEKSASVQSVSFTGAWPGFRDGVPLALGVAGYGLVFGVLARDAGLSTAEATLMSGTVMAGTAQFVAVGLWATPLPAATVLAATVVVNLRYVLMGATLRPWLGQLRARERYASLFFTADENWALTLRRLSAGSPYGAYLLGSGLAIWVAWVLATLAGALAGERFGDPSQYGLGFVLPAVLLAVAVDLWDGWSDVLPWSVSAAVAVAASIAFPGQWYILAGGLAGAVGEVVRRAE